MCSSDLVAPPGLEIVTLSGTPYQRGFQHGQHFQGKIRSFYQRLLGSSLLPYLSREQPDIAGVLPYYQQPQFAQGNFAWQLLLESGRELEKSVPPDMVQEMHGIADGYAQILGNFGVCRYLAEFMETHDGVRFVALHAVGEVDHSALDRGAARRSPYHGAATLLAYGEPGGRDFVEGALGRDARDAEQIRYLVFAGQERAVAILARGDAVAQRLKDAMVERLAAGGARAVPPRRRPARRVGGRDPQHADAPRGGGHRRPAGHGTEAKGSPGQGHCRRCPDCRVRHRTQLRPPTFFMALTDIPLRVVLYEGTGATPLGTEERLAAVNALLDRGFGVTRAGAERPVAPDDRSPLLVAARWQERPAAVPEIGRPHV